LPLSGDDSSELNGSKVPVAELQLDIPIDSRQDALMMLF